MEKLQSFELHDLYQASSVKEYSFKERLKQNPWLPGFLITMLALIMIFIFTMIAAQIFKADLETRQESLEELLVLRVAGVEMVGLEPR